MSCMRGTGAAERGVTTVQTEMHFGSSTGGEKTGLLASQMSRQTISKPSALGGRGGSGRKEENGVGVFDNRSFRALSEV